MTPQDFLAHFNVRWFYHFTDQRNLPSIKEHGLLSWERLHQRGIAPVQPGGNDWSHEADAMAGVHRYVHLCMFREHPMEYLARKEGRIQESKFLLIDRSILATEGVHFTAAVSNKSGVQMLTLAEAIQEMDFEVVYKRTDWRDPSVQARLRLSKKYELLVPNEVPPSFIRGF